MIKFLIITGAFLSGSAVLIGAFGAHALKNILDEYSKDIYEKAVFYHFIHSLSILVVANFQYFFNQYYFISGILFILGILIFSGSLYILSITGIRWIGAFTPIGGLCFILGWFWITYQAFSLVK